MGEADSRTVCEVYEASHLGLLVLQECLVSDAVHSAHVPVGVLVWVKHACQHDVTSGDVRAETVMGLGGGGVC